jgi:hypothetical protein
MTRRTMSLRSFTSAAVAVPFALLVAGAAHAGGASSSNRSADRGPAPSSTLVPAVIVFAAIGATVARMNRRGGPR